MLDYSSQNEADLFSFPHGRKTLGRPEQWVLPPTSSVGVLMDVEKFRHLPRARHQNPLFCPAERPDQLANEPLFAQPARIHYE